MDGGENTILWSPRKDLLYRKYSMYKFCEICIVLQSVCIIHIYHTGVSGKTPSDPVCENIPISPGVDHF